MQIEIIEKIQQYETIIIHRHVRPDPDALGSQAALKYIIQSMDARKNVYMVGEDDPSLTFLVEMDTVSDETFKEALIIACDTANAARIDDARYKLGKEIIKIDHHPNVDSYGVIQWVDTSASSTSEMIYEFYEKAKHYGAALNGDSARLLYAGIIGDTGRFLFPSTTKKTMQYAGELLSYDFDRSALFDNMYNITEELTRLSGYIKQNFKRRESGLCTIKLSKELLEQFNVDTLETGQLAGILGNIKGVKSWVFFIEETELIRVRIRSKGPVINDVAAQFHGGGHPLASGAVAHSWEEAKQVVEALDAACKAHKG